MLPTNAGQNASEIAPLEITLTESLRTGDSITRGGRQICARDLTTPETPARISELKFWSHHLLGKRRQTVFRDERRKDFHTRIFKNQLKE